MYTLYNYNHHHDNQISLYTHLHVIYMYYISKYHIRRTKSHWPLIACLHGTSSLVPRGFARGQARWTGTRWKNARGRSICRWMTSGHPRPARFVEVCWMGWSHLKGLFGQRVVQVRGSKMWVTLKGPTVKGCKIIWMQEMLGHQVPLASGLDPCGILGQTHSNPCSFPTISSEIAKH